MLRSSGSVASLSTRRTNRTARSGRTNISETDLAALLSKASHQATMAARSILVAGGSRGTALSTAQAAAQGVLCPSSQEVAAGSITLGKRRAKRHAEIIGSMVLMSLVNSHPQQGTAGFNTNAPSPLGFSTLDVTAERTLESSISSSRRSNQSSRKEIPLNLPKKNTPKSNASSESKQGLMKSYESNLPNHSNQAKQSENSKDGSDQERKNPGSHGVFRKKAALSKKTVVTVSTISEPGAERHQMSGFLDCVADGEETISTNSQLHSSYSSVDWEGEETVHSDEHAEALERKSVDGASTQGFMKRNVDPLLTTITNAFICGPANAQSPTGAGPGFFSQEGRDETNVRAEGGATRGPPPRNRFSKITRNGESLSTYDSEQLLRDLNNSDSSSSARVPGKRSAKAQKKVETETMESVVLRALSPSPEEASAPNQTNNTMLRSADDVFAGIATDGSVEEASSNEVVANGGPGYFQFNKGGRFRFLGRRKKKNAMKSE